MKTLSFKYSLRQRCQCAIFSSNYNKYYKRFHKLKSYLLTNFQRKTNLTNTWEMICRDVISEYFSLHSREQCYHNSVTSPQNPNILVAGTVLTQHLAEIGVVQVRILISQLLPFNLGPHHKRVHWSSYSLLL